MKQSLYQYRVAGQLLKTYAVAAVVALTMLVVNTAPSQAAADALITPRKIKKIGKKEIERARKYFTDTEMVDQNGKRMRFYSDVLDGRVVLLNVIYTDCKGSCPMMTAMLHKVKESLGQRFGKDIHFVSISNNPESDTPAALTKFANKQGVNGKGWHFLTGEKNKINHVISKLGLYSKNYEEHKAMLLAGNTRTGHWMKIPPNQPTPSIVMKLNSLADEG